MHLSFLFDRCRHIPYIHTADDVSYATERFGGTLYLYLEHSNGTRDWLRNIDFPSSAYKREGQPAFSAHRGFLRAFGSLETELSHLIADQTLSAVVTVGYSHGAALGALAHEYIWHHRKDLRATLRGVGFGSPRVFYGVDGELLSHFSGYTVVRNLDDIVTHLPPAALGYSHVGTLLSIGERGRYSRIDAHREENIARELSRAGL